MDHVVEYELVKETAKVCRSPPTSSILSSVFHGTIRSPQKQSVSDVQKVRLLSE